MLRRAFNCSGAIIHFFLSLASSDGVVLDSGEASHATDWHVWLHIIVVQIVANIPVEIPITAVTRIALMLAPDLLGRLQVPPEDGNPVRGVNRRKYSIARTWAPMQKPVCIHQAPANVCFL